MSKSSKQAEEGQNDLHLDTKNAYQTQTSRLQGASRQGRIGKYDAEEHWHMGPGADAWAVEELGPRVWLKRRICAGRRKISIRRNNNGGLD